MQLEHLRGLIELYTYFALFPLVVLEGPIVTIVAGFLVHIRVLNFFITYVVIVLADVAADVLWYSLGRFARGFVEKIGNLFGVTKSKLDGLDSHFIDQGQRTVFFGKFILGMEVAVLVAAGMAKFDFRKFAIYTMLPTLPKSLFFLIIGYYFGGAFQLLNRILKDAVVSSIITFLAVVVFYFIIYKFFLRRIKDKISL
jgi:membrane protein DedA with SNARE-associated domain